MRMCLFVLNYRQYFTDNRLFQSYFSKAHEAGSTIKPEIFSHFSDMHPLPFKYSYKINETHNANGNGEDLSAT